jgi:hypothetical protein
MSDEDRVEKAKFDLGDAGAVDADIDAGNLPWSYGEDRITALVVDPDSAYVYWELTDDALAGARSRLGPGGAHGWCNLRVYDVTGRAFDGTNANSYVDVRVERDDREHFLTVRRPGSTLSVEIGIKTTEGYFQAIVRSGPADFPRASASSDGSVEWAQVAPAGPPPPCVAPYRSRFSGPEPPQPGGGGSGPGGGMRGPTGHGQAGAAAGGAGGGVQGAPGFGAFGAGHATGDTGGDPYLRDAQGSGVGPYSWPFGSSWSGRPPGSDPSGRG